MHNVYKDILLEGCRFLIDAQDNGVPFDKDRLNEVYSTHAERN